MLFERVMFVVRKIHLNRWSIAIRLSSSAAPYDFALDSLLFYFSRLLFYTLQLVHIGLTHAIFVKYHPRFYGQTHFNSCINQIVSYDPFRFLPRWSVFVVTTISWCSAVGSIFVLVTFTIAQMILTGGQGP